MTDLPANSSLKRKFTQLNKAQRRWAAAGVLLSIVLLITGVIWILSPNGEDPAWEQAVSRGVLRVGMDAAYPPFEYLDENGEIVGFDVDLARDLGQRLDLEIEFVNIAYDGLYDSLLTGHVDVLISALVPLHAVDHKADFSQPYFDASDRLVLPDGSTVQTMADLAGKRLAVEYGSGGDVTARQWVRRVPDLEVLRYADPDSVIQAVLNGEADAALVDGSAARLGVGQHEGLFLGESMEDTYFTMAVPPDSDILRERLNQALEAAVEDGTLDRLLEKWFGPQQ